MIFYNFFENIKDVFKMTVKYKNNDYVIKFRNGSYSVSDISDIINLKLKENNIDTEEPIKLVVDINQYKILIIVKENFRLILDKNFMKLLEFSKYLINPGSWPPLKIRPHNLPSTGKKWKAINYSSQQREGRK